jgi:hypothetical protein
VRQRIPPAELDKRRVNPCRFIRQVKKVDGLDVEQCFAPRPLPARPAGESGFGAIPVPFRNFLIVEEPDSPAAQWGRGLITRWNRFLAVNLLYLPDKPARGVSQFNASGTVEIDAPAIFRKLAESTTTDE